MENESPPKATNANGSDKAQSESIKRTLSSELKSGTSSSHQAAENVAFVRNFIKGKINYDSYKYLISSLYHVYCGLEEELSKHAPVLFPGLHKPLQLFRTKALEEDMVFFFGPNWKRSKPKPSPAATDYCNRIRSIGCDDPLLLIAHAYTRYMGDLSGGRILRRVARKAMDLDQGGLAFYDFDKIPNPKAFKDDYRRQLDEIPITQESLRSLVKEANIAFLLNIRVFQELDVMEKKEGAEVMPLQDALCFETDDNVHEDKGCPFAFTSAKTAGRQTATQHLAITGTKHVVETIRSLSPFASLDGTTRMLKLSACAVAFSCLIQYLSGSTLSTVQLLLVLACTFYLVSYLDNTIAFKSKDKNQEVCPLLSTFATR